MRDLRLLTPHDLTVLEGGCSRSGYWQSAPSNGLVAAVNPPDLVGNWVEEVTADWAPPGRVAYVDGRAVGVALLAPARHVPRLAAFATAPVDPAAIVLLTVEATGPDVTGVRKALFHAVARDALRRGARSLEAIGARPRVAPHPCVLAVDVLERWGFRVAREHPAHPRMRLDLRTALTLREDARAVLAGLLAKVPRPRPEPGRADGATRAVRRRATSE